MILPAYRRADLKNQQWKSLQPLLPPSKSYTGRPYSDHRRVLNGILWILRTGAPWRDLPEHYGPWQTNCLRTFLSLASKGDLAEHFTEATTTS